MTERDYDWSWARRDPEWTPPGVDTSVPSQARVYDYLLGGKNNYLVDQQVGDQQIALFPSSRTVAINNRRFLRRAVRFLAAEAGVRQFLDHGSGLPTQDNVHQVAQRVDPACRVVYIDNDPIVLAHGRALLAENDRTTVICADMRDTEGIWGHPEVQRLIDFSQPVGVLFVGVLHGLPDSDDPGGLVQRVMARVVPGSFLAFSHLVSDDPEIRQKVTDFILEATRGDWGRLRTVAEVTPWFDGLELVPPGLVEASRWRPDPDDRPQDTMEYIDIAGVARKPS